MSVLIDLHVHTRLGSADSSLDPASLAELGTARGIGGVVVSEHYRIWTPQETRAFSTAAFRVFAGAEVMTDAGHVLVIGMERYPVSRSLTALREETREAGAAIILAHPFRGRLDHWRAVEHPDSIHSSLPISCLDGLEVANGGCTERENSLARALARDSQVVGVAGSDAHTGDHVGNWATVFDTLPDDERDLARRLIQGSGIRGTHEPH